MECKDRKNHSALALPYSFLPAMTAKKLRDVAEQAKDLNQSGTRPSCSICRKEFLNALSKSWTATVALQMILWGKQAFLWNHCLWPETCLQLLTMWSRNRNFVEKCTLL